MKRKMFCTQFCTLLKGAGAGRTRGVSCEQKAWSRLQWPSGKLVGAQDLTGSADCHLISTPELMPVSAFMCAEREKETDRVQATLQLSGGHDEFV